MRVEWKHEDFVCKHAADGSTVTLWDGEAPTGATMPAADDIKVFALVTATEATAE